MLIFVKNWQENQRFEYLVNASHVRAEAGRSELAGGGGGGGGLSSALRLDTQPVSFSSDRYVFITNVFFK